MKRKIIASVLASVLLLSAAALAATARKTIDAEYGIGVKVNGQEVTFKDVAGNIVEPFTFAGTTYAPIRGVAEALGATVGYDAIGKSANIEVPIKYDVALDALTAMNCYKDIEAQAGRAWELQGRTLTALGNLGRIDKAKSDAYILKLSTEDIPALDEDIREMELAIKGLRETTDSDYLEASLEATSVYLEALRTAVGDMRKATIALALYSSTKTDKAYNDLMECHKAADAVIDAVIEGAAEHYDSMYTSTRILMEEALD